MAMHDITEYTQKLADTFTKQGNIATVESTTTASKAYAVDDFLIYGGQFYKVTTAIAQGDTIVTTGASANVEPTTVTDEMGTGGGPVSGVLLADGSVPADNLTIGSRATGGTVGQKSLAIGTNVIASGDNSVAQGTNTTAMAGHSSAQGYGSTARVTCSHAEGHNTIASGNYSHAEGSNTRTGALDDGDNNAGAGAHAEGYASYASGSGIMASGQGSHAEGWSQVTAAYDSTEGTRTGMLASGNGAHAEGVVAGNNTFIHAVGLGAHAEGYAQAAGKGVLASSSGSHAEGQETTASKIASHAEGAYTKATANYSHAEGRNTIADTNAQGAHVEGYSTPEGSSTVGIYASGVGSHAEGYVENAAAFIRATGKGAHAEGYGGTANAGNLASGAGSHAEGCITTASGNASHAEGSFTTASGDYSHAEGFNTKAVGTAAHAEGGNTSAGVYNHAQGHRNKAMTAGDASSTNGDAMAIGNGVSTSILSNCFRVTYAGAVYGLSAFNSSGADYAEFFEWADGNENEEDRVGLFVTLDGDKIKPANSGDYILGIISGQPSVVGNGDEDWLGRWQRDDFGRFVWGDVEVKNPETKKMETVNTMLANPDYDNTQTYVERKDRKEWDYVGMLGTLAVRDNGKCKVNGYCACGVNGIAVPAESGYRVIKRVSENVIKVIVK